MEKKKNSKTVRYITIAVLAVLILGSLLFFLFKDTLIRVAIEKGTQSALKVDVRLENISTSLLRGMVDLVNFEIDNPEGYEYESFMKLGHVFVHLNTPSLLSNTIQMEKIQLDDIKLFIEQKGLTSNLKEILDNLPKAESEEPETMPESKPAKDDAGKNLFIKVLEINNIEVKTKLLPLSGRADTITLKISPIRLENLGAKEKLNIAGLTAKIVRAIATGVTEQGAELLPENMLGSISGQLGKQGESLKGAGEEIIKGGTEAGKDAAEAIQEGLGGLLKKKDN